MSGALGLPELVRRYGASVPQDLIWAANSMGADEVRHALAEDREAQRALTAAGVATEEERRARALEEATLACGIPRRFASAPVDSRFAERLRSGRGLYVWGSTGGSGKTWAACAAVRGWISQGGRGALFSSSVAVMDDLRSAMTDGRGSEAAVGRYAGARLLVVDDVGKEAPTPWVLSQLFELCDRRYGAMLPTVWTSQLSPAQLADRLASRGDQMTAQAVVSRIVDSCDVVEYRGGDRRLAARRGGQE